MPKNLSEIAEIIGPRLPEIKTLDCEEEKKQYTQRALILLKPFRTRDDLFGDNSSYLEAWKKFKKTSIYLNSEAPIILENIQEFYNGKRRAREQRELYAQYIEDGAFDSDDENCNDNANDEMEEENLLSADKALQLNVDDSISSSSI